jgi:hypothetical protein
MPIVAHIVVWNISQHLLDVPQDEIVAAAARVFGR